MAENTELQEFVKNTLSFLDEQGVLNLIEKLLPVGIQEPSDFQEEIVRKQTLFNAAIPEAHVNKLYIAYFKLQKNAVITNDPEIVQVTSSNTNVVNFKVNWELMDLDKKLKKEIVLKRHCKLALDGAVDQLFETYGKKRYGRKVYWSIAADAAKNYPNAFHARVDKAGTQSFRNTMRTIEERVNYLVPSKNKGKKNPKKHKTLGTIAYTVDLPLNETPVTQNKTIEELQALFKRPSAEWNLREIKMKMDKVYSTLRNDIDKNAEVSALIKKYPFLAREVFFFNHYEVLTGKNAENCVANALEEKLTKYIKYFTTFSNAHKQCAIIQLQMDKVNATPSIDHQLIALMKMITVSFKENFEQLLHLEKEPETLDVEIEQIEDLPTTPVIVALGHNIWNCKKYCIVIEKKVIERVDSFKTAFAYLFASYYVFAMYYAPKAASTLQFIQWCIFGIRAEDDDGSKCYSKGRNSTSPARKAVESLSRDIEAYESTIEDLDKEDEVVL